MYEDGNNAPSSDVYSSGMLKELDRRSKNVRFAITRMDIDIEKASVNLHWIYSAKAYKAMGYESIIDYALSEFDIAKSTTYNYITLAERFGRRGGDGEFSFDGFDKKYASYSSSKLNLLAPLTDEEIDGLGISPEMSVRDIKKKIKRAKDGYEMVYLPTGRFKKPQGDGLTGRHYDSPKPVTENSKENDDPDYGDGKSADDTEGNEADDDGIIGYSYDTLLAFHLNETFTDDFLQVINRTIQDASIVYNHPDTCIEINVRYPVTKFKSFI
ncbi:MAG: hypothetical protein NC489_31000 [Ruminococcus flavefaciens]|nr:hypothetical protein [Ruminococcus flavefaciens]